VSATGPGTRSVGLVGYGRVGRDFAARVRADPGLELDYVLVRSVPDDPDLDPDVVVTEPAALADRPVDLCVEAATPEALADVAPTVLEASDVLVLSGSAFATPQWEERLTAAAERTGHDLYVPHAALLGLDGLVDARDELDAVSIEATKAPGHLDFSYTDAVSPADVDGPTVLYEGPVRGLCRRFPRNFNSHAAVAMASLGLDATRSRVVADPEAGSARHVVTATGEGFDLEIVRDSAIEGVTGDYTLVSTWGSVRRVLDLDGGVKFV